MHVAKLAALAVLAAVVAVPLGSAQAAGNSVLVDGIVISRCGTQQVALSGTATYADGSQILQVSLDGQVVHSTTTEPALWVTSLITVSPGVHQVIAQVIDADSSQTAVSVMSFEIPGCSTADTGGGSTGGGGDGDGGKGKEGDCCPGPDPHDLSPSDSGQAAVKGAKRVQRGSFASLKPLNSFFRLVFGRSPAFEEWKYWANRMLTDKPGHEAIIGAMQWHKLHGRTVGN